MEDNKHYKETISLHLKLYKLNMRYDNNSIILFFCFFFAEIAAMLMISRLHLEHEQKNQGSQLIFPDELIYQLRWWLDLNKTVKMENAIFLQ